MPKHETKEQGAIRRQTASNMRKSSTFFAEADKDANQNIDFEEFYAMQPGAIHERFDAEQLRTVFNLADRNGDGACARPATARPRTPRSQVFVPRDLEPTPEETAAMNRFIAEGKARAIDEAADAVAETLSKAGAAIGSFFSGGSDGS